MYFCPINTYEKLSKRLNIVQIYIDQKALIVEGNEKDISKVVEAVNTALTRVKDGTMNDVVQSKLKDQFSDILQYMDSKRDRDLLEAVIAKITSVSNVVSMKGKQFMGSLSGHKATLDTKLKQFNELKVTSQTVRNDMTVSQQHTHFERRIKQRNKRK